MTSFGSLWGCGRGEGDRQAGKGSAVVLQEVCAHPEVSGSAAHVARQYKAGRGSRAAQLRRFAVPGAEGRRKAQERINKPRQGSGGVKRSGEAWKLPRHTAPKGESGTGTRGEFLARGALCFSPCF